MTWLEPPAGLRSRHLRLNGDEVLIVSFPLFSTPLPASLTSAERDVAFRALTGASNRTIALERGSSVRTVANQLSSIFKKLRIGSRAELAWRMAELESPNGSEP
jgi:DNA-binding NarL/FixJ family response regulator